MGILFFFFSVIICQLVEKHAVKLENDQNLYKRFSLCVSSTNNVSQSKSVSSRLPAQSRQAVERVGHTHSCVSVCYPPCEVMISMLILTSTVSCPKYWRLLPCFWSKYDEEVNSYGLISKPCMTSECTVCTCLSVPLLKSLSSSSSL